MQVASALTADHVHAAELGKHEAAARGPAGPQSYLMQELRGAEARARTAEAAADEARAALLRRTQELQGTQSKLELMQRDLQVRLSTSGAGGLMAMVGSVLAVACAMTLHSAAASQLMVLPAVRDWHSNTPHGACPSGSAAGPLERVVLLCRRCWSSARCSTPSNPG